MATEERQATEPEEQTTLQYAVEINEWSQRNDHMTPEQAEEAQITWVENWPGPRHPMSETASWTLGCTAWVELCRHTPAPLMDEVGLELPDSSTTYAPAFSFTPPTASPLPSVGPSGAQSRRGMSNISELVALVDDQLPRGNPLGWTQSDMTLGWPSLAAMALVCLDVSPLRPIHAAMRWRTGALASGAWDAAVMDDETARLPPTYSMLVAAAPDPPTLAGWHDMAEAGQLWMASEEALSGMATYDQAVTRWFLAAEDFPTKRIPQDMPAAVLERLRVPPMHQRSALYRVREGRPAPNVRPGDCPVAEVARRLRAAVLVRACGLADVRRRLVPGHSREGALPDPSHAPGHHAHPAHAPHPAHTSHPAHAPHPANAPPGPSRPTPTNAPTPQTSLESYLISICRLTYAAKCEIPGDPERYRNLHPAYRVHNAEACRRLHPQLTTAVMEHLEAAGVDLWTLQHRAHPGPVPGAQRAMCAELLWYNVGDHIRQEERSVGPEMLRSMFVVPFEEIMDANERIDREPDIPLLLEGPSGLRCVWRRCVWEAADTEDPWTPVATWWWIARYCVPGCKGVANDIDCVMGGVDLNRWISQVGPIFQ